MVTYEVGDMGLGCNVLDSQLGEKCTLVVGKDQLVLWDDVYEVRANVETGSEQVSVGFEVLFTAAAVIAFDK